ncbi:MAG: hypothetical protein IPM56_19115 [Ignavibacteriales bacterium]|nr:MAG: hypothetical protein IPM56_19115 [Ignavibacteriales bacterium]
MKRIALLIALLITSFIFETKAQEKGFGLGIILGEPTGISGKAWTSSLNAVDFALGYSFSPKNSRIHLHVDYLFHSMRPFDSSEKFLLYYGPGVRIKSRQNDDSILGIRGVIGLAWIPRNAPVDIFLEVVPILNIIPGTSFNMNAGLGARFYF